MSWVAGMEPNVYKDIGSTIKLQRLLSLKFLKFDPVLNYKFL